MAGELPEVVQNLVYVGTVTGATIGAIFLGRKKAAGDGGDRKGEGVVVAGSFMERQAMLDLATSIRNLDGSIREMLELGRQIHHDAELERAVRVAMAEARRRTES